jgi:hypothetical protein
VDLEFFSNRLHTIASYQYGYIGLKSEQKYYFRYVKKLRYKLLTLGYNGISEVNRALNLIKSFEEKEQYRVKNGLLCKPRKALEQACEDCRDVMESMRRYEGVESV